MTALLQRWRTRIDRRHPSDERLIEAASGAGETAAAMSTARHLRTCARCARRAADLRTFLDTLADGAGASFEEAFPPDRIRAQRARIDHRLARVVGRAERARVLAFPFRRAPERRRNPRPNRWAVAATAAGLALGLFAGQLVHFHRGPATSPGLGATFGAGPGAPAGTGANATLDMTGTIRAPPRVDRRRSRRAALVERVRAGHGRSGAARFPRGRNRQPSRDGARVHRCAHTARARPRRHRPMMRGSRRPAQTSGRKARRRP